MLAFEVSAPPYGADGHVDRLSDLNGLLRRCAALQELGQQVKDDLALAFGRLAVTEDELADAMERRSRTSPGRGAQLLHRARLARQNAAALRRKQAEILGLCCELRWFAIR